VIPTPKFQTPKSQPVAVPSHAVHGPGGRMAPNPTPRSLHPNLETSSTEPEAPRSACSSGTRCLWWFGCVEDFGYRVYACVVQGGGWDGTLSGGLSRLSFLIFYPLAVPSHLVHVDGRGAPNPNPEHSKPEAETLSTANRDKSRERNVSRQNLK
jgi:hypothetical protein